VRPPLRRWLDDLSTVVWTVPISPAIAGTAAGLPESFPRDPADRLVYATAVEHGLPLVTKDQRLRRHRRGGAATVW
jgi:PIN domain nuclease of toxin-antitoxin system